MMKDMGELYITVLGISIKYKKGVSLEMDQIQQYIHKMVEKYRQQDAKPVSTLADPNVKLCKDDGVSN